MTFKAHISIFFVYLLTNIPKDLWPILQISEMDLIIKFKNDLYTIIEFQHVKPGKGGAFVRTTLKNLKTGKVLDNTFRSGEGVEIVRVERRKYQYLYRDSDFLVCMDNDTYEQINVPIEYFGDGVELFKRE